MSGVPDSRFKTPMCLLLMDKLESRVGDESKLILRPYELYLVPYACLMKFCKERNLNILVVLIDITAHK